MKIERPMATQKKEPGHSLHPVCYDDDDDDDDKCD
jgi:hypothetical protein